MSLAHALPTVFVALSAPGMGEWGVILVIVLVLFGGKNIPDLARALGNGVREFKRAMNAIGDEPDASGSADAKTAPHRPAHTAEPTDRDRHRPA